MSDTDCCGAKADAAGAACPACGVRGAPVPTATVEALQTATSPLPGDRWRACASGACSVVWYGEDGETIDTLGCRVRVFSKETEPDRPVCYCFGVSAGDVTVRAASAAPVSAEVRERCRRGEDRCETTNPRGMCCLGDIRRLEKAVAEDATSA